MPINCSTFHCAWHLSSQFPEIASFRVFVITYCIHTCSRYKLFHYIRATTSHLLYKCQCECSPWNGCVLVCSACSFVTMLLTYQTFDKSATIPIDRLSSLFSSHFIKIHFIGMLSICTLVERWPQLHSRIAPVLRGHTHCQTHTITCIHTAEAVLIAGK